jgi:hypothetical protein
VITPGMFRESSVERAEALRTEARRVEARRAGPARGPGRRLRLALGTRLMAAGLRLIRGGVT